jgi:Flp pilus assembly protein TadG
MRLDWQFLRNENGATLIETSLVFTLLILLTLGFVDFARAFSQWNTAEKATQIGVRAAVITDPVREELADFDCDTASIILGTLCSDASAASFGTITCNGATSACTAGGITGGNTFDSTAFTTILSRMQVVYPGLQASQVIVEYRDVGLGFAGREAPVPAVTVRLNGISFNFLTLNTLLGLPTITMPDFRATLIGEDLTAAGRA